MTSRIGVDTGGTFTDAVTPSGEVFKLPSTPADPAQAVASALTAAGGTDALAHGTTVATNALLERRGGRVALLVSEGQRDIIEIARQVRPSLYDPWADRPEPLVPRELRFEVPGRLDSSGKEIVPLGSLPPLPDGLDAVAICLLHSDLNPQHEEQVAAALEGGPSVARSSRVSPEHREYERTVTTVLNGYLQRPCASYLEALSALAPQVLVMTSAGGLVPVAEAAEHPVSLLLSGPSGGVLAASMAAVAAGYPDCVTIDMGGTSTDVCLVLDGNPAPAGERIVAGLPVRVPSLDVVTIGAGGGSIARVDAGGALKVGPDSAGALPGPACYGLGSGLATVTDADLVAGRLPVSGFGGLGKLDLPAARGALEKAGVEAEGVIAVVDEAMVQAVRAVSVARGVDPGGLALVAFGGAGPVHACALAAELGMPAVVVPPRAGVLSAVGILGAPRQVDLVSSCRDRSDAAGARRAAESLARRAASGLPEVPPPSIEVAFDCRYAGQSHEITVASPEAFGAEHQRRRGWVLDAGDLEVVAVRASARSAPGIDIAGLPPPDRRGPVAGPAMISEPDCTIWVAGGWRASVDPSGSWVLRPR